MRILIDTNVLIELEDNKVIGDNYSELIKLISPKHVILVHPASVADIDRDGNESRKTITKSKLKKYQVLETPPTPDASFLSIVGEELKASDRIDNCILYSLFRNCVHLLVTEDQGIHRKSIKLGLQDRVFTVAQAKEHFTKLYSEYTPFHPRIEKLPVYSLDIKDNFFDSLRQDYGVREFNSWFSRICSDGRFCWALREDGKIIALAIYKKEEQPDLSMLPPRSLKLSTFKVSEFASGQKVGELLLKITFSHAYKNQFRAVYLTVFPKHQALCTFLTDFGFEEVGKKPNGELIFAKDMTKPTVSEINAPVEISRKHFPYFYDGSTISKFLVPILPEYHSRLFPDSSGRQMLLDESIDIISEGNAIKKAYLCNSKIRRIRRGDIVIFYRSRDTKSATSLGVVENTYVGTEPEIIASIVAKRTVYSYDEIERLATQPVLVIIFRHMINFEKQVNISTLNSLGIVNGPIQSIRKLNELQYISLRKEARINENITFN